MPKNQVNWIQYYIFPVFDNIQQKIIQSMLNVLKVDCLPNAVGKQPSIPLIYLGRKWTLNWWWWWICYSNKSNTYLDWIKTTRNAAILNFNVWRRMCILALLTGTRTVIACKLPTYFQCQPSWIFVGFNEDCCCTWRQLYLFHGELLTLELLTWEIICWKLFRNNFRWCSLSSTLWNPTKCYPHYMHILEVRPVRMPTIKI